MLKLKEIVDPIPVTVRRVRSRELMNGVERSRKNLSITEPNHHIFTIRQSRSNRSIRQLCYRSAHQNQIGVRSVWNVDEESLLMVKSGLDHAKF
ncbi:MAG: hypothetical protein ACJAQT_003291 [Akkermansiaceae bacterium]|jgi:hypothetical protein